MSFGSPRFRPPDRPAPRDRPLALSASQTDEWAFDRFIEGAPSHQPTIVRLRGPLRTAALRSAYTGLVRRHECLRTRFPVIDGEPVQVIGEPAGNCLPMADLSALPGELREGEITRIVDETYSARVVLDERPPGRVALIRLAPEEHLLLIDIPHIVADLWSATLLNDELMVRYRAARDGLPPRTPAPPAQYADYAQWQRAWWTPERIAREAERWRDRLDGLAAVELPVDRPRSPGRRRECFLLEEEIDAGLAGKVREFARNAGVTPYVVLLAAFHWLVARSSGADRFVTTSLVAARHGRTVQTMTGPFSDYLVVVGDLAGDPDFAETVRRVREECLVAHDHQRLPLPELIPLMDPGRELHPHPLEQIGFNLHNIPAAVLDFAGDVAVSELEDGEGSWDDVQDAPTATDLTFEAFDYGTGHIPFDVIADGLLTDPGTARAWAEGYRSVLRAVLADPAVRLSHCAAEPVRRPYGALLGGRDADLRRVEAEVDEEPGIAAALLAVRKRRTGAGLVVREPVLHLARATVGPAPDAYALRRRLRERLPGSPLPAALIECPLAEIRKALDARAAGADPAESLPPPEACTPLPETAPPPEPGVDRQLAALWAQVRGAPPDSMTECFFRPGVSDKDAAVFLDRVAAALGVVVPLADFLEAPNLLGLKGGWL
ncbi:condensation domain-containing protein [Streptomyces sp. NPDC052396]|uniref:condensation domain-containing protein n=1 Tax=Streptomyces sp. NPDC052396 TaxID=3365689 RepID=UPI0037D50852